MTSSWPTFIFILFISKTPATPSPTLTHTKNALKKIEREKKIETLKPPHCKIKFYLRRIFWSFKIQFTKELLISQFSVFIIIFFEFFLWELLIYAYKKIIDSGVHTCQT